MLALAGVDDASRVDDREVDFAYERMARVDARPVHAVVEGVGVGQVLGKLRQGQATPASFPG